MDTLVLWSFVIPTYAADAPTIPHPVRPCAGLLSKLGKQIWELVNPPVHISRIRKPATQSWLIPNDQNRIQEIAVRIVEIAHEILPYQAGHNGSRDIEAKQLGQAITDLFTNWTKFHHTIGQYEGFLVPFWIRLESRNPGVYLQILTDKTMSSLSPQFHVFNNRVAKLLNSHFGKHL